MLSGLRQTFRRHGFLKTIPYAASRLLKQFMVFDVSHLMLQDAREVSVPKHNADVECRFITADEVRVFAKDPNCDIDPSIAERLATGYDFCFGGILDGTLVSYCWLATHSIEKEHNKDTESSRAGIALSYPDAYAFRYKGFTHPDYRGRRIYQRVGTEACLAMQELGVRYILSTAEFINYGALKSSYRSGYEYLGLLGVADLYGIRFLKAPNLTERGIFFDSNAKVLDRALISNKSHKACSVEASEDENHPAIASCSA